MDEKGGHEAQRGKRLRKLLGMTDGPKLIFESV